MTALLPSVTMPQLSGGRERAQKLASPLKGKMAGKTVRLDCRELVAGTASFADEIIKQVLVDGQASKLIVEYAGGGDFADYLYDAAKGRGFSGQIEFI